MSIHFGYISNWLMEPLNRNKFQFSLPIFTSIWFYQLGLCLVHSPLLETSLLFSFPSLIDMLKLWEFSYSFQILEKFVFLNFLFLIFGNKFLFQFKKRRNSFCFLKKQQKMKFLKNLIFMFFNIKYIQRMLKWIYNQQFVIVLSCIQRVDIHLKRFYHIITFLCVLPRLGNWDIHDIIFKIFIFNFFWSKWSKKIFSKYLIFFNFDIQIFFQNWFCFFFKRKNKQMF